MIEFSVRVKESANTPLAVLINTFLFANLYLLKKSRCLVSTILSRPKDVHNLKLILFNIQSLVSEAYTLWYSTFKYFGLLLSKYYKNNSFHLYINQDIGISHIVTDMFQSLLKKKRFPSDRNGRNMLAKFIRIINTCYEHD